MGEITLQIEDDLLEILKEDRHPDITVSEALHNYFFKQQEDIDALRLSDQLAEYCLDVLYEASQVWREADADVSGVQITAANYAGYGRYAGMYHPRENIISFPTGNSFSLVETSRSGVVIKKGCEKRFRGILMHEIGHGVVALSKTKPWSDLNSGQPRASTHLHESWCWIAATGWQSQGFDVDAEILANTIRYVSRDTVRDEGWVSALKCFSPYDAPPKLDAKRVQARLNKSCANPMCSAIHSKRGKYCSDKCRVQSFLLDKNPNYKERPREEPFVWCGVEYKTIGSACRDFDMNPSTVKRKMQKKGLSKLEALQETYDELFRPKEGVVYRSVAHACKANGIDTKTYRKRIKQGMTPYQALTYQFKSNIPRKKSRKLDKPIEVRGLRFTSVDAFIKYFQYGGKHAAMVADRLFNGDDPEELIRSAEHELGNDRGIIDPDTLLYNDPNKIPKGAKFEIIES